jgi:hypothetical protein
MWQIHAEATAMERSKAAKSQGTGLPKPLVAVLNKQQVNHVDINKGNMLQTF